MAVSNAFEFLSGNRFIEPSKKSPGKMGGHKPKKIRGRAPAVVTGADQGKGLHLRGLVAELAERGLKVDYWSVGVVRSEQVAT